MAIEERYQKDVTTFFRVMAQEWCWKCGFTNLLGNACFLTEWAWIIFTSLVSTKRNKGFMRSEVLRTTIDSKNEFPAPALVIYQRI